MKVPGWSMAAAVLAIGAIVVAVLGDAAPAVVLGGAAIAVVLLGLGETTPSVQDRDVGQGDALLALLASMDLRGVPAHLAPTPEGTVRWFVPAGDMDLRHAPEWDGATTVDRSGTGIHGAYLPSPEEGTDAWLQGEVGVPGGRGLEEAVPYLRQAFAVAGMASDLTAARTENLLRVSWRPTGLSHAAHAALDAQDKTAVQVYVPGVSIACMACARAVRGPVRPVSIRLEDGHVVLVVET